MPVFMPIEGITRVCFAASYAVALAMELLRLFRPARAVRGAGLFAGAAGLLAHTFYLVWNQPSPASPAGSLLILAWVLAVFYLYGSLHHARLAWGVFVLPVVLALVGLSAAIAAAGSGEPLTVTFAALSGERFWGIVHGSLLLLAAVGVSVGFFASVMYLIQAHRLRAKVNPAGGLRLLSLERLERMNRRAIDWAFPLLTAGLLLGVLLLYVNRVPVTEWAALKVFGTAGLWLVGLLLLYLRYGAHLPGRRLAVLTIAAFALMVVTLAAAHPLAEKSEMANPKSEPTSKPQIQTSKPPARTAPLSDFGFVSDFGFRICFGFRISDFGFRISPRSGAGFRISPSRGLR